MGKIFDVEKIINNNILKKYVFFSILLILTFIGIISSYNIENFHDNLIYGDIHSKVNENHEIYHPKSGSYIISDPIIIGNNNNFSTIASEKGWSGSGIQSNPYIINNLNISNGNEDYALKIENTDVYFELSHCMIDNYKYSLYFHNVSNFNVTFNIITNCINGIIVYRCKDSYLFNNTLINIDFIGMNIIETENSILNGNYIKNTENTGIRYSHNNGKNRVIYNNTIQNCSRGIGVETTPYSNVSYNVITDCFENLKLEGSYNNISRNVFAGGKWGIYNIADYGTIIYNNFMNCEINVDDPRGTNLYVFNFWSDFRSIDSDSDGYYDVPYIINNLLLLPVQDEYPVVNLYYSSKILLTTNPIITLNRTAIYSGSQMEVPIGFLSGFVKINWTSPQNTFNLSYNKYALYYSKYQQNNWTMLMEDPNMRSYVFNSSNLDNNMFYSFKIIAFYGNNYSAESESALYLVHYRLDVPNITQVIPSLSIFEDDYTLMIDLPETEYDHSFSYSAFYSLDNGKTWIAGKTKNDINEKDRLYLTFEEFYPGVMFSTNAKVKIVIECSEGAKDIVYSPKFTLIFIPIWLKILVLGPITLLSFPVIVKIYKSSYLIKKERDIVDSDEFVLNMADEVKIRKNLLKIILLGIFYLILIYNFLFLIINSIIEDIKGQEFESWASILFLSLFLVFGSIFLKKQFYKVRNESNEPEKESID